MSVQLVLVHLRFFHSVSCGWLPFWGSPAGCSFTRGRPYGKRSSSSSRSGGRQRFRGVGGGGLLLPALRVSGGGYHLLSGGCLSLHWQAWRDRDAEPWVVEVLQVGYCLPFLSTPPLSNVPIPMPSSSPTSIKGAALEEVTLGFIARGAVELIHSLLQTSTAVCS